MMIKFSSLCASNDLLDNANKAFLLNDHNRVHALDQLNWEGTISHEKDDIAGAIGSPPRTNLLRQP